MLRLWLFGELALERQGRPLEPISSRRARSLLAWLALHPGLHPRSRVASVFWPDVLEESARMSLRTTLSTLRRECEPAAAVVVATRDRVGIGDSDDVWIDARAADELIAAGRLEEGDRGVRESYGANYARLAEIKAMYDPENLSG